MMEPQASILHCCVSAGIRAELAVRRLSGNQLAAKIGRSQNYVATRLRDEKPFSLDDVEDIADALMLGGGADFIAACADKYAEQMMILAGEREHKEEPVGLPEEWALAAQYEPGIEEDEAAL